MTSNHDDQAKGSGLLLGAGAALLMVACCALLPLLVAGGAIAGIGGVLRNPWVIGAGVTLLALAVLATRRRHLVHDDDPSCCPPALPSRADQNSDTKDDQTR